jgi:hypothetical protein
MLIIKWTALIGATALFAASARAETITFGPALERAGWNVVSYPRIKPAIFHAENDTTLDVAADSAAGLLWHPVDATLRDARTAQWRWRVDEGVGPTDLTRRGRDDRALAVYFIFGAVDDLGKSATRLLASHSVRTLVYVFGGNAPRDAVLPSPHMGERGKFVILRSGNAPRGTWFEERVDLGSDYMRAFDSAPDLLLAIAVSTDSDDTGGRNRARLTDFKIGE